MPARLKTLLIEFGVPLLLFAFALGAAEYKLSEKEDSSIHAADIQRLESRDKAQMELLLDTFCAVKPADRRCK